MAFSHTSGNPSQFPDVPDTLRTDPSVPSIPQQSIEPRADTAPYITPYLSLPARLSQIWINRWTVLLIILLARLIILIAQLRDNIADAETQALSACTKVEDVGSAMASMPHYLSQGVNELIATGVEKTVHGMVEMLDLVISGVEGIIIFYINFLTATYTCLITALIHGSLEIVANVTADATKTYNKFINGTVGDMNKIATSLQKGIANLTAGIEDTVFGSLISEIPTVNFSKPLNKLLDFQLNTTSFVSGLQLLDKDLPTFEDVQNFTESAISLPFEALRTVLDERYANYTFNKSAFPLAEKQQMTFCSDNDSLNNIFDHLFKLVAKARVAFIVVISLAAIAVIAPMAWLEIRRWRQQRNHAKLVTRNDQDPMDVVYIVSRPFTASYGLRFTSKMTAKRQILVRWCIAYATSPAALFVLSLALSGFLSCIFQYILLRAVEKETPELAQEVGHFADNVVGTLQNVSQSWADGANGVITGLNDDINHDLLDYVSNATGAVNNTINVFMDKMEEGLEFAFNGTILLGPIKSVLHCVIGLKVESVQKGLTWVHDHAHVELPLFPNDTFSAGANTSLSGESGIDSFLASPSDVTTNEISEAVSHVTKRLHNNLVQEALMSTGIFLTYVIIVLIGVIQTLIGMATSERGRAEGGIRYPSMNAGQMHSNAPAERSWSQDPPPPWEPAASSSSSSVGSSGSARGSFHEKFIYGAASPIRPKMTNNPYDYPDEKTGF
ncbi:plasma membrane fusion protein PRM1 [Trichoderma asperellum]|uniref:Plasma membrane fusion protein PRM1 n=1 Tax=Trichoderma asperellum TaxID=101201 RepID=A0A6V8R8U6_TRIAP|nr:plasma membrane fusion protein PRM1 [Trichoderma asperellum]